MSPRSKTRSFLCYWLPVLAWMGTIFFASTDVLSGNQTSRFIGPILRWIDPGISEEAVAAVQLGVRKAAHLVEYAILALLLWRALQKPGLKPTQPWNWSNAGLAFLIAALYAISDEWHQSLTRERYGSGWDVLIDSIGAAAGLLLIWFLFYRRKDG